jgi:transposase
MTKRSYFTKEFKQEAIRVLESGNKSATELARELGIRRNILYKWRDELSGKGEEAFKGPGRRRVKESREVELEQENQRLKEENEILKKAAAYFARDLK